MSNFSLFRYGFAARRLAACLLVLVAFASTALAKDEAKPVESKKALVLATFGTTVEQKKDRLALVRAALQKEYPDLTIVTAYTSNHVIKTLRKNGKEARGVAEQLGNLGTQGYTHVAVQSLHITGGLEFDAVRDVTGRFNLVPKGIKRTSVGMPLIATENDAALLAKALIAEFAPAEKDTAVVFVGHGAHGTGSLAYSALQCELWAKHPLFFVGTIEGLYGQEDIIALLKEKKVKKVKLLPLLTVVGDHAVNDLFGDEEDSWKSALSKAGLKVEAVKTGVLDHPFAVNLWVEHAKSALAELE